LAANEAQARRIAELEAEIEAKDRALANERHRATNAEYFVAAYRNMLGVKGLAVAAMWDTKKVTRVHISWGPDAGELSGEERAAFILAMEDAPRRLMLPGEIDGHLQPSVEVSDFLAARAATKANADGGEV